MGCIIPTSSVDLLCEADGTLTASVDEINMTDGDTVPEATVLTDIDALIVNDEGIMKQVVLSDFVTYFVTALSGVVGDYATLGANTFSGTQNITNIEPQYRFKESDGALNEKVWSVRVRGGEFQISALTDDYSAYIPAHTITRNGITIGAHRFYGTITSPFLTATPAPAAADQEVVDAEWVRNYVTSLPSGSAFNGAKLRRDFNFTATSDAGFSKFFWEGADFDTNGWFVGGNITVPAGVNYVEVTAGFEWDNPTVPTGRRAIRIYVDGDKAASKQVPDPTGLETTIQTVTSGPIAVSAGSLIWLTFSQTQGSSIAILKGNGTFLAVTALG